MKHLEIFKNVFIAYTIFIYKAYVTIKHVIIFLYERDFVSIQEMIFFFFFQFLSLIVTFGLINSILVLPVMLQCYCHLMKLFKERKEQKKTNGCNETIEVE